MRATTLIAAALLAACPGADPADGDAADLGADATAGDGDAADGTPLPVNVLEEATGTVLQNTPFELLVSGAHVMVAAGAAPAGTVITLRRVEVTLAGARQPWRGEVFQLLPSGLQLGAAGGMLVFDQAGAGPFVVLTAAEDAAAWTDLGAAQFQGQGTWSTPLTHFSFWALAPEAGEPAATVTFAGLVDARTATDGGGGVILSFPRAATTATHGWFGFPGELYYVAYVSPTSGGQTFQRAHDVLDDFLEVADSDAPREARVSGLAAGSSYCFVVRAHDSEGSEDANTVERCAVAGVMAAPTVTLEPISLVADRGQPFFEIVARSSRPALRIDLERSPDGTTWTPRDSVHADFSGASFRDQPPGPGTWHYRARAYDDGASVAVSAPMTAVYPVTASPGPLRALAAEPRPNGAGTPQLHVDAAGRLLLGGNPTAGTLATADLGNPRLTAVEARPDLWGAQDPDVFWFRVACGVAQYTDHFGVGRGVTAIARDANGDIFVSDGLTALYRLAAGGTGCAERVSTTFDRGLHAIAPHPTDPATVVVVDPRGVHVSRDFGATFSRWVPDDYADLWRFYLPTDPLPNGAAAWSPDGARLWVGLGPNLATSVDFGSTFVPEAWPAPEQVAGIDVRADGVAAVVTHNKSSFAFHGVFVGTAGALVDEPIARSVLSGRRDLLWLPDGRLLVLLEDTAHGFQGARRWLGVRAAGGGWSGGFIAHPHDTGPLWLDPIDHDVRYEGWLRTRDGGASWDELPLGRVLGVTTDGTGSVVFGASAQRYDASAGEPRRSIDQGETWTVPAGGFLQSITPNPVAPLRAVAAGGHYTSDGGASWANVTGATVATMQRFGWLSATTVYACSDAGGPQVSEDGGATWAPALDLDEHTRHVAGNGVMAIALTNAAVPAMSVSTGGPMLPVSVPAALASGGGRLGGMVLGRGASPTTGVVYAVVVPVSAPPALAGCSGALWRSSGGLSGPWINLDWTVRCDIRVDPFDADPDDVLGD